MFRCTLALTAAVLGLSQVAFAMPAQPEQCPDASAIQTIGLQDVVYDSEHGKWVGYQMHNDYETNDSWTFVIGMISAKNAKEATKKADAAMSSLQFQMGPIAEKTNQVWMCAYHAGQYQAAAINPAIGFKQARLISNLK